MGTRRCCCGSCVLGSDDFDRPDSDDPGPKWSEEDGDWDIDGNRLRGPVVDGLLATRICHPVGANLGSFIAYFDLDSPEGSKVYKVRAGDPHSSPYEASWEFAGTPGAGTINISVTNGAETNSFSVVWQDVAGPYNVSLCYLPGVMLSASKPTNIAESGSATYTTVCITADDAARCFLGLGNFSFLRGDFDNWVYEIHWMENHKCKQCMCPCRQKTGGVESFYCVPDVLYATVSNIANCPGIDATKEMNLRAVSNYNSSLPPSSYVDYSRNFWISDKFDCPTGETEMSFCIVLECQNDLAYNYPRWIAHVVRWMPGGRNCSGIGFLSDDAETIVAACSEIGAGDVCYVSSAHSKSPSTCSPLYLVFGAITEYFWSCPEDLSGCCGGSVNSGGVSSPPAYMSLEITE